MYPIDEKEAKKQILHMKISGVQPTRMRFENENGSPNKYLGWSEGAPSDNVVFRRQLHGFYFPYSSSYGGTFMELYIDITKKGIVLQRENLEIPILRWKDEIS